VEVCGGASVGECGGDIALVGQRAVVTEGMRLAGGGRLPDDD
jgi:hypothetical protein